jgi:hypothetical protein
VFGCFGMADTELIDKLAVVERLLLRKLQDLLQLQILSRVLSCHVRRSTGRNRSDVKV